MKKVEDKVLLEKIAFGDFLYNEKKYDEAASIYKELLGEVAKEFKWDICELNRKIGNCYYTKGGLFKDSAIKYYEETLRYCKVNQGIYSTLAYIYFDIDIEKAIFYYKKAIDLKKDHIVSTCGLSCAILKSDKFNQKDIKDTLEESADNFRKLYLKDKKPFCHTNKDPNKKLHIGYLSGDYRNHAMFLFSSPLLYHHHRDKFDISLYSVTKKLDSKTDELKEKGLNFIDCSKMGDFEIAQKIFDDKVDILVDLSGFTALKCFLVMYKPAPIIIEYLGFNNTTGIKEIDYVLTDKYTLPPSLSDFYTEKPLYINTSMQRFLPSQKYKKVIIDEPPYKKNGYITFGSFNNVSKISDSCIELWAKLLHKIPNSKLLISRTQLLESKIQLLKDKFKLKGILEDRLIFNNKSASGPHMNLYVEADVALDPTPFSGLTITLELILTGIPVLTMPKETMHSRSSARVNLALGLEELIAYNEEDYIKKAKDLADNPKRIDNYRKSLREKLENSFLMNDFEGFALEVEEAYRKCWIEYTQK